MPDLPSNSPRTVIIVVVDVINTVETPQHT
jgi:hypothetical protein